MTLNSLLTGLRGQAAMQSEIIALRHQLTVLQRTQNPKSSSSNHATDACGFHSFGRSRKAVSSRQDQDARDIMQICAVGNPLG
jgi:hypothetical protein